MTYFELVNQDEINYLDFCDYVKKFHYIELSTYDYRNQSMELFNKIKLTDSIVSYLLSTKDVTDPLKMIIIDNYEFKSKEKLMDLFILYPFNNLNGSQFITLDPVHSNILKKIDYDKDFYSDIIVNFEKLYQLKADKNNFKDIEKIKLNLIKNSIKDILSNQTSNQHTLFSEYIEIFGSVPFKNMLEYINKNKDDSNYFASTLIYLFSKYIRVNKNIDDIIQILPLLIESSNKNNIYIKPIISAALYGNKNFTEKYYNEDLFDTHHSKSMIDTLKMLKKEEYIINLTDKEFENVFLSNIKNGKKNDLRITPKRIEYITNLLNEEHNFEENELKKIINFIILEPMSQEVTLSVVKNIIGLSDQVFNDKLLLLLVINGDFNDKSIDILKTISLSNKIKERLILNPSIRLKDYRKLNLTETKINYNINFEGIQSQNMIFKQLYNLENIEYTDLMNRFHYRSAYPNQIPSLLIQELIKKIYSKTTGYLNLFDKNINEVKLNELYERSLTISKSLFYRSNIPSMILKKIYNIKSPENFANIIDFYIDEDKQEQIVTKIIIEKFIDMEVHDLPSNIINEMTSQNVIDVFLFYKNEELLKLGNDNILLMFSKVDEKEQENTLGKIYLKEILEFFQDHDFNRIGVMARDKLTLMNNDTIDFDF